MHNHHAACLNCGRSEEEFPIVVLRLSGKEAFICPQCLPALIHHPDRLTNKLIGALRTEGAPPCHD